MKYDVFVWAAFAATRIAAIFLLSEISGVELFWDYSNEIRAGGWEAFYRDRDVEYPALAVAATLPPSFLADYLPESVANAFAFRRIGIAGTGFDRYQFAFQMCLLPFDAFLLLAVGRTARRIYPNESLATNAARRAIYILATGSLGCILYDRLDLYVGGFVLLAIWAFTVGRGGAMAPMLVAGTLFKIVPAFLLPSSVLFRAAASGELFLPRFLRESLVAGAWLVAGLLATYLAFGPRAFEFLKYHAERGVQIQASYGWLLPYLDPETHVVNNYSSHNFDGPLAASVAKISTPILLACLAVAFAASAVGVRRYGPTPSRFVLSCTAVWLMYILGNKVGSPQYLLWLIPIAALTPLDTTRDRVWAVLFMAYCQWTGLAYPRFFWDMIGPLRTEAPTWAGPTPIGSAVLIVQSLLLLVAAVWATIRTASRGR